jgi:GNAT superfamily N-acetyltransferase
MSPGVSSDSDLSKTSESNNVESGNASPRPNEGTRRRQTSNQPANSANKKSSKIAGAGGGRLGHRLPQGLSFDAVRASEVGQAFKLEQEGYNVDDAASMEMLKYRQKEAPHLFLGAFLPLQANKVSGPLNLSGPAPRKLIGYACATAASALTARSLKFHTDDENSWLVCLHSVCVAPEYRHKGLALKLVEEYIRRLRRIEEGHGDRDQPKRGYECVACLSHEDTIPLFEKAGFKKLGVSHVNIGSGGWFELRRNILTQEQDDDDIDTPSSGSPGKARSCSPPADRKEASGDELQDAATITTPTQELERRLQAHADAISSSQLEGSALDVEQDGGPEASEPSEEQSQQATIDTATSTGFSSSPPAMSPTLQSPKAEIAPSMLFGKAVEAENTKASTNANPFSSAQMLQALQKKSNAGERNPGIAYSTIMGQTMASKTSVEDAFYALEARLVNRDDQSNLADLYCPREECSCLILRKGTADWDIAEMGPLMQPNLSLPNSPAPPAAPVPPPPTASMDRVRSALGTSRAPSQTTAPHVFWTVSSAMLFDNVGFSKDADWKMPPVPSASMSSYNSDGTSASNNTENGNEKGGNGSGERKKPVKRGSILRATSEWIAQKQDKARERRNTNVSSENGTKDNNALSPGSFASSTFSSSSNSSNASNMASQGASSSANVVKVKYLLCAECDCGPIGYTVLPSSMQDGGLARDVGNQTQGQPSQQSAKQEQIFFVAADRVRYRLPK